MTVKPFHSYRFAAGRVLYLGDGQYRAECPVCRVWSMPGGNQTEAEAWVAQHQQTAHQTPTVLA